jgi:short-subunit dehydrogenase
MDFPERYGPWAIVAGASEGVGASVARLLGGQGVNVVLVARRQGALDEVATTVATETRAGPRSRPGRHLSAPFPGGKRSS